MPSRPSADPRVFVDARDAVRGPTGVAAATLAKAVAVGGRCCPRCGDRRRGVVAGAHLQRCVVARGRGGCGYSDVRGRQVQLPVARPVVTVLGAGGGIRSHDVLGRHADRGQRALPGNGLFPRRVGRAVLCPPLSGTGAF